MLETKPSFLPRYAVRFAIVGDLRFLSHHDTLRMFERALVRSRLPLRYSAGFNPNPKLALPLPRPVGVAGLQEWLLLQLTEPLAPAEVAWRLGAQLAGRIDADECWRAGPGSWQALEALYEVPLADAHTAGLSERVANLLAAPFAVLERPGGPGKASRTIDARAFLADLELIGHRLRMRLRFIRGATARPADILRVLGLATQPYASRVTRVSIAWGPRDLRDGHLLTSQSRPTEEAGAYDGHERTTL